MSVYNRCLSNRDLLYSTGNYIQYSEITYNGKDSEKEYTELLCYTPEINITLQINYTSFNEIKKIIIKYKIKKIISFKSVAAAAAAAASLQSCLTPCDPIDGSPSGFPSLGFSRQEHWSGLPFPSPVHESEK